MISFVPGPSQVYPQMADYLQSAYEEGILSLPHRSERFSLMYANIFSLFQAKFGLPSDFRLYFVGSATECWTIIAQNYGHLPAHFWFNGTFGKRWFVNHESLNSGSIGHEYSIEAIPDLGLLPKDFDGLVALTINETSNGTYIPPSIITELRAIQPNAVIALDATSILGATQLTWQDGDLWFCSSQKCLGLPAGLGLLFASPKAVARANYRYEYASYLSIASLENNFHQWQTTHTPNVLAIYLLEQVLKQVLPIVMEEEMTLLKKTLLYSFLRNCNPDLLQALIVNPLVQSPTVVVAKMLKEGLNNEIASELAKGSYSIGQGYGDWKRNTLRFANFPQHHINDMIDMLECIVKAFGKR
jgi:phosphoserine aminotransferase